MKAKYDKVIVIGLDGADWRLLDPWIENGDLPTLARLISEGARGRLRSTVRPESSVAWSSFSTGVNPGKHGVFGFAARSGAGYAFHLANASSVRVGRFWDVLGAQGLKVGMLNIPFTYPPSPVNGFMVTGMLTPGTDVSFTYPDELKRRLLSHFGDYFFDSGDVTKDRPTLIEQVRAFTRQQRETALLLLQENPWDFFAMVFTGPDRLQHFLWADLDPRHPFHDSLVAQHFGDALLAHYRALDEAIAAILAYASPDTLLILMSDHGFNACARRFYVNRWLQERGLLVLNGVRRWRSGLTRSLSRLGTVPGLRRLKRALFPDRWSFTDLHSMAFTQTVDWSCSKAYFGLDGGLRINLRGREPAGIVSPGGAYEALCRELRQTLLAVVNPATQSPVLSEVFLREELYDGPFVAQAPDLILEPQRDHENPACNFVLDGGLNDGAGAVWGSSAPYAANHTLDGVLVVWGAGVASGGRIEGAQIVDLAPTVLASLGVAIPEYMDGRVLSGAFLPGRVPVARQSSSLALETPGQSMQAFSHQEEQKIEARLRDLGYLD